MMTSRPYSLGDLPQPPSGKTGWPWTVEAKTFTEVMQDGHSWPCISVVTPSFNQGRFIEETIRSVLLQGYPNLEYFIIDGGSTDNTVEVIQMYEPWLAGWVSERDKGQAHAVNKGWMRSQGPILGWLNSDDLYMQGAFFTIAEAWGKSSSPDMIYGDAVTIDVNGTPMEGSKKMQNYDLKILLLGRCMPQPAVFISRNLVENIGMLDESLNYGLDFEFFLRAWLSPKAQTYSYVPSVLAASRNHADTKCTTGGVPFVRENVRVLNRIWQERMQYYHALVEWRRNYAKALVRQAAKAAEYGAYRLTWSICRDAARWSTRDVLAYMPRVIHSFFPRIAGKRR